MNVEISNQRITAQRRRILEYLKSVKTHPRAEVIFEAVRKDIPKITLATVYRNLNILADNGEILKFIKDGEARFDGDVSSHQHCFCRVCGNVEDVFCEDIDEYALDRIGDGKFFAEDVHVFFYGKCQNCYKGGENGK